MNTFSKCAFLLVVALVCAYVLAGCSTLPEASGHVGYSSSTGIDADGHVTCAFTEGDWDFSCRGTLWDENHEGFDTFDDTFDRWQEI